MPYLPPSIQEIIDRVKTDIQTVTEQAVPTEQNNLLYAFTVALANLSNDLNKEVQLVVIPNSFPQTAQTVDDLQKFADLWDVPRNPATVSEGKITATGTVGTTIPINTKYTVNGNTYTTQASVSISAYSIGTSSVTRIGSTVTVVTSSDHNFASGQNVTISGANEADYNGTFVVTVTALNEFQYTLGTAPTSPATGTIIASADLASIELISDQKGLATNLSNGDPLQLVDSIAGVDNTANAQFSGVTGGADEESKDDWQARIIERYRNPITRYNEANIIDTAKRVTGVTKVWVQEITPAIGQVTVYFIRGNDPDPIPDANEVQAVKDELVKLLDANDDEDDLFVFAPTPVNVDFTFNAISPNTPTMQEAIRNTLAQYFEENTEVGEDITELQYNNAIGSSYDLETGESLKSYTLTIPSGDIAIADGELGKLGNVTFT